MIQLLKGDLIAQSWAFLKANSLYNFTKKLHNSQVKPFIPPAGKDV